MTWTDIQQRKMWVGKQKTYSASWITEQIQTEMTYHYEPTRMDKLKIKTWLQQTSVRMKLGGTEQKQIHPKTHTRMFTTALSVTVKNWKYPKCPRTGKWLHKSRYIYSVEYYSATWPKLKSIRMKRKACLQRVWSVLLYLHRKFSNRKNWSRLIESGQWFPLACGAWENFLGRRKCTIIVRGREVHR